MTEPPSSVGTEIRAAHYPRRAPIDAYRGGRFRFADMSHRGSLLCLPSGIYAWAGPAGARAMPDDLARVFAEADDVDILLIGCGADFVPVDPATKARCREAGIVAEAMATSAAVRTYNVLLGDGRRVAAALIAVD